MRRALEACTVCTLLSGETLNHLFDPQNTFVYIYLLYAGAVGAVISKHIF